MEGTGRVWPSRDDQSVLDRATTAWKKASLPRVTPHVCRHTFASMMIAAGVPAKRIQSYMGHSTIGVTFDLYGHLFEGDEAADAARLSAFLTA